MEQTISNAIRVYCIQLKGGGNVRPDAWPDVIRIRADCMTRHSGGRYTFHREGQEVGAVLETIAAWWIEEGIAAA